MMSASMNEVVQLSISTLGDRPALLSIISVPAGEQLFCGTAIATVEKLQLAVWLKVTAHRLLGGER
jgi:hypothetical protein